MNHTVDGSSLLYRAKSMSKPRRSTPAPLFYRCPRCGELYICDSREKHRESEEKQIRCCGGNAELLIPQTNASPDHALQVSVIGGLDSNGMVIRIGSPGHPMQEGHRIEWVCVKTYEGLQMKRLQVNQKEPVIFALAQNDAYQYCNKNPCEDCKFHCKRGFLVYAYCTVHGLWSLAL